MRINGRAIASKILKGLKNSISRFSLRPILAIILVGNNPTSISYIKQKQKAVKFIGAKIILKKISQEKLFKTIGELNENPKVHGIVVQLPLPPRFSSRKILTAVSPEKDIDGFSLNSPFTPPVAKAVLKIFREIQAQGQTLSLKDRILIIGRGITAGKPITKTLKKLGYKISVSHSKTTSIATLAKKSDVVISCVGKPNIVTAEMLKPGAIVIGVGIHQTPDGKFAGDFNEEEIAKVASFYTPTPGGVGPITVACLMENFVKASRDPRLTHNSRN